MTTIGHFVLFPLSEDKGRHSTMTSASTTTTKESSSASTATLTAGATRPKLFRRDSGMSAALQSAILDHIDRQDGRRHLREKASLATGNTGPSRNDAVVSCSGNQRRNDDDRDAEKVLDEILSSNRGSSQSMTERALALQKAIGNYLERVGSSGNTRAEIDRSGRDENVDGGTKNKTPSQDTAKAEPKSQASIAAAASRSFISIASSSSMSLFDDLPVRESSLALAKKTLEKNGTRAESEKLLASSMPGDLTSKQRCSSRENFASLSASIHGDQGTDSNDSPFNISNASTKMTKNHQDLSLELGYYHDNLMELNDKKISEQQHGLEKQNNFRLKECRDCALNGQKRIDSCNDLSSGETEVCTSSSNGSSEFMVAATGTDSSRKTREASNLSTNLTPLINKRHDSFALRTSSTSFPNIDRNDGSVPALDSLSVSRTSLLHRGSEKSHIRMPNERRRSSPVRRKSSVLISDERIFHDSKSPNPDQTYSKMLRSRSCSQLSRSISEGVRDDDTDQHYSRLLHLNSSSPVSKTITSQNNARVADPNNNRFPHRRRTSFSVQVGIDPVLGGESSFRTRSTRIGACRKLKRRATFHHGLEPEAFDGTNNPMKDNYPSSTRQVSNGMKSVCLNDLISCYNPQTKLPKSQKVGRPSRESHVVKTSFDSRPHKNLSNKQIAIAQERKSRVRDSIPPPPRRRKSSPSKKNEWRPPSRSLVQQHREAEHPSCSREGRTRSRTINLVIRDCSNEQHLSSEEMADGHFDDQVNDASQMTPKKNQVDNETAVSLSAEKSTVLSSSKPVVDSNAQLPGGSIKPGGKCPPPPPRLLKFDNKSGCCPKHPSIIMAYKKNPLKSGWTIIQNRCHLCDEGNKSSANVVVDPEEDRLRRSTVSKSLHRDFMAITNLKLPCRRKSKVDECAQQQHRDERAKNNVTCEDNAVRLTKQAGSVIDGVQRSSPCHPSSFRSNEAASKYIPSIDDSNQTVSQGNNRSLYHRSTSLPDNAAFDNSDPSVNPRTSIRVSGRPYYRTSSLPENGDSAPVVNKKSRNVVSAPEESRRNAHSRSRSSSNRTNPDKLSTSDDTATISIVKDMPYTSSLGTGAYTGEVNQRGKPNGFGSIVCGTGGVYEGKWTDGRPGNSVVVKQGGGMRKGGILKRSDSSRYHQWGQTQKYFQKSYF